MCDQTYAFESHYSIGIQLTILRPERRMLYDIGYRATLKQSYTSSVPHLSLISDCVCMYIVGV
jgi:hypothetical protein